MENFDNSKTKQNLARAFAGECQDGARYQFLAKMAMEEGYPYLQSIFKTHAKNEMAHAKRFFDLLNEHCSVKQKNIELTGGYPFANGTLLECILDTMDTEKGQSDNVSPEFARVAREEGFLAIARQFEMVAAIEKSH